MDLFDYDRRAYAHEFEEINFIASINFRESSTLLKEKSNFQKKEYCFANSNSKCNYSNNKPLRKRIGAVRFYFTKEENQFQPIMDVNYEKNTVLEE